MRTPQDLMNPYSPPARIDGDLVDDDFLEIMIRVERYAAAVETTRPRYPRDRDPFRACYGCAWARIKRSLRASYHEGWPGWRDASALVLAYLWEVDPGNGLHGLEPHLQAILDTPLEFDEWWPAVEQLLAVATAPNISEKRGSTTTTRRQGISHRRRYTILQRDGFKCQLCGRTAEHDQVRLEVDHQQPVSKGGTNDDANLWTLCNDCNAGKSDRV
jgi:hypothetical protein